VEDALRRLVDDEGWQGVLVEPAHLGQGPQSGVLLLECPPRRVVAGQVAVVDERTHAAAPRHVPSGTTSRRGAGGKGRGNKSASAVMLILNTSRWGSCADEA